jgi:hypothetical protein
MPELGIKPSHSDLQPAWPQMPIPVTCPECDARLTAPDSAAGKRIRCPKCSTLIRVEAPTIPSRKGTPPGHRGRLRDSEPDDEDEERPRKSGRTRDRRSDQSERKAGQKRKKVGMSPLIWLAVAAGVLLLLGGGATAVYFMTGKTPEQVGNQLTGGGPPPNWKEVDDPEGGFRVYLPRGLGKSPDHKDAKWKFRRISEWQSITGDGVHQFGVAAIDIGQRTVSNDVEGLKAFVVEVDPVFLFMKKVVAGRSVTVGGHPGAEIEVLDDAWGAGGNADRERSYVRLVVVRNIFYVLVITTVDGKMDSTIRSTFFDSFRVR